MAFFFICIAVHLKFNGSELKHLDIVHGKDEKGGYIDSIGSARTITHEDFMTVVAASSTVLP